LGREPRETHEHYDADGIYTGKTIVTRDPEFDANERDNWHAVWEYEQAMCPQCHQLRVICEDPNQQWSPQLHECRASAVMTASNRLWARMHEKAKPDQYGRLPTDGTRVWVAPAESAPDDTDFLGLADLAAASAGEAADQQHDA
jgi:hypothetical protein